MAITILFRLICGFVLCAAALAQTSYHLYTEWPRIYQTLDDPVQTEGSFCAPDTTPGTQLFFKGRIGYHCNDPVSCTWAYEGTPPYTVWGPPYDASNSPTWVGGYGVCSAPMDIARIEETIPPAFQRNLYPGGSAVMLYHQDKTLNCNNTVTVTVNANGTISGGAGIANTFNVNLAIQAGGSVQIQAHYCQLQGSAMYYDTALSCSGYAMDCYVTCPAGSAYNPAAYRCEMCGGSPPVCDLSLAVCTSEGWTCGPGSPIILDLNGDGFDLTSAERGVSFDLNRDGALESISWTSHNSDDAWLVLDRNGNGRVDDGGEMFGNHTTQPSSANKNGFTALAEFDKPVNGGNGDGTIDSQDQVFARLQVWRDANHNGISESTELSSLASVGIQALELHYQEKKWSDENGNQFRFRARIRTAKNTEADHWAYDVFLVSKK